MRLDQRFAPQRVHDIVGQDLRDIEFWLQTPSKRCLFFVGDKGTGKTSCARCIAKELRVSSFDYHYMPVPSTDQIRNLVSSLYTRPMVGKWRLVHLEEFERLDQTGQNILKSFLDDMPKHLVVVACSNSEGKLDEAFLDRFDVYEFVSDSAFVSACEDRLVEIWLEVRPESTPPPEANQWGKARKGSFSMRKAMRDMSRHLERSNNGTTRPLQETSR